MDERLRLGSSSSIGAMIFAISLLWPAVAAAHSDLPSPLNTADWQSETVRSFPNRPHRNHEAVDSKRANTPDAGAWQTFGGLPDGCNGPIYASVRSGSGDLFVGGRFNACGEVAALNVARWDGQRWSALGAGAAAGVDGSVRALAYSGNTLYAGGEFLHAGGTAATHVASWDGATWSSLGNGVENGVYTNGGGFVYALAVGADGLYVGGYFRNAGTTIANNIARWDGANWHALGQGIPQNSSTGFARYVQALAVSGTDLFVGGYFPTAGSAMVENIARWNGSVWSPIGTATGPGDNSSVAALALVNGELYVGGGFTQIGGVAANSMARWNGSTWSSMGSGIAGSVSAIAAFGGDIYVGGVFSTAGGAAARCIARWNGSAWSTLNGSSTLNLCGSPYTDYWGVNTLSPSVSEIYIGGGFRDPAVSVGSYVVRWTGSTLSAVGDGRGNGINGPVFAVAGTESDFYVGGNFARAGSVRAHNVAHWNGTSWSALGATGYIGTNDSNYRTVGALAIVGESVYVGGDFYGAGSFQNSIRYLGRWDGTSWSVVGGGVDAGQYLADVSALSVSGGALNAGGFFQAAGGVPARNVAQWDGATWHALGTGPDDSFNTNSVRVYAFAQSGSDLFAGGRFRTAGGSPALNVARWDGANWSSLGIDSANGTDGVVSALSMLGTDLYVGGQFVRAGGIDVFGIARWTGSSWGVIPGGSTVGVNAPVTSLATLASNLYVGGGFTMAGDAAAPFIARWDGNEWTPLGSPGAIGTTGPVFALAATDSSLLIGGYFGQAGGRPSVGIAIYRPPPIGQIFADDFE